MAPVGGSTLHRAGAPEHLACQARRQSERVQAAQTREKRPKIACEPVASETSIRPPPDTCQLEGHRVPRGPQTLTTRETKFGIIVLATPGRVELSPVDDRTTVMQHRIELRALPDWSAVP